MVFVVVADINKVLFAVTTAATVAAAAAIADINLPPRFADISRVPCSLGDVFIRLPVDRFSVIADAGDMSNDRCRPT